MTIAAAEAAETMIANARARSWGLAVAAVADGNVSTALDPGDDELTEHSYFQIGSITKTMTGLLLAETSLRGEVKLTATAGLILGADAGACANVTLLDLATQQSGLPRLPPNLDLSKIDQDDPYAAYTEADLLEALRLVDKPTPGVYGYSNMGFMLLGLLLCRITGITYANLVKQRVFEPLGMTGALCGIPETGPAMPAYNGRSRVPWWRSPLPGAGGVASSIRDLATYCASHLSPPPSMAGAVDLAIAQHVPGPPPMGLGWFHQGSARLHDGGTGGFGSFIAFDRPTATGVVLLANSQNWQLLQTIGAHVLTEMVNSRL